MSSVLHSHLKELIIGEMCFNTESLTCVDFSKMPLLTKLSIGDECFTYAKSVSIIGMEFLESVVIGWQSFCRMKPDPPDIEDAEDGDSMDQEEHEDFKGQEEHENSEEHENTKYIEDDCGGQLQAFEGAAHRVGVLSRLRRMHHRRQPGIGGDRNGEQGRRGHWLPVLQRIALCDPSFTSWE